MIHTDDKLFHRLQLTVAALCAIVLVVNLQGCSQPDTPTADDIILGCTPVTCTPKPTPSPSPITK